MLCTIKFFLDNHDNEIDAKVTMPTAMDENIAKRYIKDLLSNFNSKRIGEDFIFIDDNTIINKNHIVGVKMMFSQEKAPL